MTRINVFPSHLKGRPIEQHEFDGTVHEWLLANLPEYKPGADHPFAVYAGGRRVPPNDWQLLCGEVDIRPLPRDFFSGAILSQAILSTLASALISALFSQKSSLKSPAKPQELKFSNVQGNTAKLNQVIPEIAGRHKIFPDYLCQPYRFFSGKREQTTRLMLCLGKGEFDIESMKIGETAFEDIDGVTQTTYAPGASVAGNLAHLNWFNCPNIGATSTGTGIQINAGSASGTEVAAATAYTFTGSSILVQAGGGALPQDWEVGNIVTISAFTRPLEIVDGGGSFLSPNRDLVRGDFADLGLAVGDTITIDGDVVGTFEVITLSSETEPGTASQIVGVVVANLEYSITNVTLYIAGQTVLLDDDYADADDLAAAIDGQVAGVTVSQTGGVITVTDDSPYDGQQISLSGNYSPVFGATPTFVTGTATRSYDEMTLDIEETFQKTISDGEGGHFPVYDDAGNPVYETRMTPATSLTPGLYSGISMYKTNRYRITALVSGTLPDGNPGTVGMEFQRILSDGTDDPDWAGFSPETTTPDVTMRLETNVVGGWVGWFNVSPNNEVASKLEYDLFFPSGLIRYNKKGKPRVLTVTVEIQISIDGVVEPTVTHLFQEATPDQIGFTYTVDLPEGANNIKIRARRIGAESTDSAYSDRIELYGARSLLPSATSYAGVTTMAVEIVGSELLAAQTSNQVNLIVTRKLNGVAERGIVPWARYVLDSIGIDSAYIDEDEFDRLDTLWTSRGDYFDYAQLSQNNVRDVLNRAFGAGFAEVTVGEGLIRPVRDESRTTFEESYSAQNMSGPLRRAFQAPRPDEFDGVDVTYLDPDTFVEQVVPCRLPGDNGYKVETITADGITSRSRAWRIGMRRRREQKYRRWSYEWATEMDALNSGYLSYCAVIDDVPGYGRSGWIKDAWLDGLTCVLEVPEPFEFDEDATNVVAWRDLDGVLVGPFSVSPGANEFQLIAATTTLPEFDDSAEPPHVYFGTTTRWCHPVLISKVAPDGLTACKVSAFNYDERVYADDDNSAGISGYGMSYGTDYGGSL